jgi:predicted nuclease with TOPRIM domain
LRKAQENFESKRREVRALKEALDQLQKDVARRERAAAAPASVNGDSEERLREIRQKVRNLEASLKQKHEETNALQRQLEDAQAKVETLHERVQLAAVASTHEAESDIEDDLLLPQDAEGSHPVRLIKFPRAFHERLNESPHHVARGAMVNAGTFGGR